MRLYHPARIIEVDASSERYKVEYLENGFKPDIWLLCKGDTTGGGDEGPHSKMKEGDIVQITYLDFQNGDSNENDQLIIDSKIRGKDDMIELSDGQSKIKYEGNIVTFETGKVEIKLENGTKLVVEDGKFTFESPTPMSTLKIQDTDFITLFNGHVHNGNLGYPVGPPLTPIIIPFTKIVVE